ncbi:MAG TPA: tetratricopeptide repeat protein [Longimicrobiaceae bacterium]|nr:tetratricopeptide repeat protein [Longimicrobiaceae bacterium]
MSGELFREANRLWFHEGRTGRALAAYEAALRAEPTDPVVAFQLARVLSALDRFDEARLLLERAWQHRGALSEAGERALERWRARLRGPPPPRYFPELPPALLDRDRLEADPLRAPDWLTVADAAAARGMYGLAAYAMERRGGVPIDAEDAKDIDRIETRRATEEAMLAQMYARPHPAERASRDGPSATDTPVRDRSEPPMSAPARRTPVSTTAAPAEPPRTPPLPALPLTLTVQALPPDGPVGVPTTLVATLRNPTDRTLVVNRRMLLNRVGGPGEIWLRVQGPPGYRNLRGYHVDAGDASAHFFESLAPGEAVEQSWTLNDYQSLHVPGEYHVELTYHNETPRASAGRAMAVGQAVGATRFHRHA